jgi:hypothetical protein
VRGERSQCLKVRDERKYVCEKTIIIMAKIIRILFLVLLVIFFSCEEQIIFVSCSDCTETEPTHTKLVIKLEGNYSGGDPLINVYEGNLNDNVLYDSFYAFGSESAIQVTLNKKYTITATYNISSNTFIVVDSATPRVVYEKRQCDIPCYFVYNKTVDMRLKHIK